MKTAIVTDTNSGIYEAEGKELGIFVVPMPIIVGETSYYEGITMTHALFFEKLRGEEPIHTSQPAPGDVTALWDRVLEEYEELVYIPMSSGLSGSMQTATLLAEDYDGKVQVVDNRRISVTMRHSVLDAIAMVKAGLCALEIKRILEEKALESTIFLGVETLSYLKNGGRITQTAAAIGTILNIKPLLIIKGDKIDQFATVRGSRNCKRRELEEMKRVADEMERKGFRIRIGLAGSFQYEKDVEEWKEMARDAFPGVEIHYDPLAYSVCCHTGPDAFGIGVSSCWEG
jgi:hypothetical protein